MLWPQSWHSFFKCAQFGHKHASLNHEQCCQINFSFSLHRKIIFHFLNAKNGYFCEAPTKIMLQNWSTLFLKNTRTHFMYKYQIVVCQTVSIHHSWKRQTFADSAESGSNLNCSYFVVCSWFFQKIIFGYTSTYFIIGTTIVSEDSSPSYERACSLFWPYYEIGIWNWK